ncbi:MAG: LacI family DNA-binding transcriptional regulator [Bacteroidota bacterium]|nr:LacI family DNA-binding transcriptional regulator [Bacteroidota bacterium]
MHKGRVTIKDIAKELGISPSTVSRALKDHPDISPDTKKAVNELAEKLNYTPDPIALSLKSRKSKIIGIIVPEIVHYFFSTVIHGIEDLAYKSGYNVMVCESNESFEREVQNVDALLSSRVEGILVSTSKNTRDTDHFRKIMDVGVPLVFFDRICKEIKTDRVIVDDEEGAFQAVNHMIKTGCRRIVHLSAPGHMLISQNRKQGYIRALESNQMEVDLDLIVKCDSVEDTINIIPGFLKQSPRPDGFFAVNDLTAAAALKIVKENGLNVPEDISIIGFTNGIISDLTDPSLSTVEQHGYEIGKEAAQLLIDRLEKEEEYPAITRVIETKFIVKGSSRR